MAGNRELLFSITAKDFKMETFRCPGNGGQKVNKTNSGVRLTHLESGAVGESTTHRSQHENKKEALNRLLDSQKFKVWHKFKTSEMMLKKQGMDSIDEQVDKAMRPHNLKIDVKDENGRWVEESKEE